MQVVRRFLPFLLLILLAGSLAAQSTPTTPDPAAQIAQLEQQVADAKGSADNAWMLISSALVLMMTGPGLALFYGGLVRKKNVLATMMQSFAMMAIITVLWAHRRVQPVLRPGNSFIGGLQPSVSATASARSPIPTMPPPFRCRPS